MTLLFAVLYYNNKLYEQRNMDLNWMNLFLEWPVCAIIPILPLIFPIMWISINLWGIARLQTHLSQPHSKTQQQKSFQEDLDTPTFDYDGVPLPLKQSFRNWLNLWRGYSMLLGRSANIVQVLGSITALCCVDKKGILSWPNPTPEKVFFLRSSAEKTARAESDSSVDSEHPVSNADVLNQSDKEKDKQAEGNDENVTESTAPSVANTKKGQTTHKSGSDFTHKHAGTIAEVLDLTHDQCSPFKIDFDYHGWKTYINSLKPLGLCC